MSWIEREYPIKIYILEVKYSGDIAITECRCKEEPEEKDNRYGFTENYRMYEKAKEAAINISKQLKIPFPGGFTGKQWKGYLKADGKYNHLPYLL